MTYNKATLSRTENRVNPAPVSPPMHFAVLYGSLRDARQGIKGARFVVKQLEARGHDVDFIDAKEVDLPLLRKMHKVYDDGEAPANIQDVHERLAAADGYVMVTAEYNHSLPPGLKNLLDHYQREYFFKPAGIASYSAGPFGGVRAAVHLRAVLGELGMVTPSTMFAMSKVGKSFDDDGNAEDDTYERRIQQFLDELEWYTEALKTKRESGPLPF